METEKRPEQDAPELHRLNGAAEIENAATTSEEEPLAVRQIREKNESYAHKLKLLAWLIEIVLVAVGLGIAWAQANSASTGEGFLQVFPIFGVFAILAAVELSKIPAATVVYNATGRAHYLALIGLLVVSSISFETVFNGIERFVHTTTATVADARADLIELQGDIARLETVSLEDELKSEDVAQVDAERIAQLEQRLIMREKALQDARLNMEGPETRELRAQLESVLHQQNNAGAAAGDAWQKEQEWIMERLSGDAIDQRTRTQLNNRMRAMPAKQSVINNARAEFDAEIMHLNTEIEASIEEPSPEMMAYLEQKERDRDAAAVDLAKFQLQASERADKRTADLLNLQERKERRSQEIEALKEAAVDAERHVAHAAETSQMHRWASAVYGVEPAEVADNQAKRVGTLFAVFLGLVAALTGSSVAMYSEWFRTKGARPVTVIKEVPVEVVVEKEVEKLVEVEIPTLRYVYVPIPVGDGVEEEIGGILATLPPEVADDLRQNMAEGFTRSEPETQPHEIRPNDPDGDDTPEGGDYARAA